MLAYLVIREGSKYSDVRRLTPGKSLIIGRAPTCDVVLGDQRCSRQHAEVFFADGAWRLRDLGSRNGTGVGTTILQGEHVLRPGDLIRLGRSQVVFVKELAEAFRDGLASSSAGAVKGSSDETLQEAAASREPMPSAGRPLEGSKGGSTRIMHRRDRTRFLEPQAGEDGLPRGGTAATQLCRLAFELATCADEGALANKALAGLLESLPVDGGAVLLFPASGEAPPEPSRLEIAASQSRTSRAYQRVSPSLAAAVVADGEAVLARNVLGDTAAVGTSGGSASQSDEPVESAVLCAPIKHGQRVLGVVHLYSTQPDRGPEPDDLDFALAVAETLAVALENLGQRRRLADDLHRVQDQNEELREQLGAQSEIVGRSPVLAKVRSQIARVAATNATVLIRGESGVGKELVARALHLASARRDKLLVCLNCAALTESLLESELFGHERGAFTGATERKIGKFETAHGGTLFLDEIGEMSPHLQAKFLRVVEGHALERVGGSEPVRVDVRVIAATNRDLEKEVEKGNFRRDLYFRLRVVEIAVPGLRKRPEDIPILANHFLDQFCRETGRRIRGFTPDALEQMRLYRWPGNVRELKNVIERAVVLCEGPQIDASDLMLSKLPTSGETNELTVPTDDFTPLTLEELERRHIRATLIATGWNKSQTAQILGIERSTLDRKIRRYGLKRELPLAR